MRRALPLIVLAGCYNPSIHAGSACDDVCPGDLMCIEHTCQPPGTNPHPDAPTVIDARMIDGPPGDQDSDMIADNVDNCPTKSNNDQHDEDGDTIGDVCDPCPHIAGDAADADGDGVGDACDPQPLIAKQHIKFFDPFTSTRSEWTNLSNVTRVGETLKMFGDAAMDGNGQLNVSTGELRIETGGTIVSSDAAASEHQFTISFGFTGNAFHYVEFYDDSPTDGDCGLVKYDGTSYFNLGTDSYTGILPTGAWSMRVDESVAAQTMALAATVGGVAKTPLSGSTSADPPNLVTSPDMKIYVNNVDVRADYWIVIETVP